MGFDTPNQGDEILESGDVDHQQTTNRTHDGDSLSPTSVSTDEADITGETYIKADRESKQSSSINAGNWDNLYDSEDTVDNLNEFDESGNAQFVPGESGVYTIKGGAAFQSPSDGDRLQARILDVDNSNIVPPGTIFDINVGATEDAIIPFNVDVDLTAGTSYEVQARNVSSSWKFKGSSNDLGFRCYGTIKRSVVHD